MLYLASQSPRRRQLLEQLGYRFQSLAVDIPEQPALDESPCQYVSRVARQKALAGLAMVAERNNAFVLGADTEVVLDERIFGKPVDAHTAAGMLRSLAARTHEVISVVWLISAQQEATAVCRSQVTFGPLSEAQIGAYIETGEPCGKAGAYAIQGRGAAFVSHLSGSHSGVMGLPLYETGQLLTRRGLKPVDPGAP